MSGFGNIQQQIGAALGNVALNAASSSLAPSTGQTSTAVNMLIVINGNVQGLIKAISSDDAFGYMREKAIGSAVAVALVPGVYEGNLSVEKLFLFGITLSSAFGQGLLAVTGTQQTSANPADMYFNIVVVDNQGNPLQTFHDCVITRARRAIDIDSVIVVESVEIWARWQVQG